MTQAISDVLDAAADLLTPEGAWTQGVSARDQSGGRPSPEAAVCWCMAGAISQVAPSDEVLYAAGRWLEGFVPKWSRSQVIRALFGEQELTPIALFNDDPKRTQAEVVAKLREAATAARQSNDMEGEGR